MSSTDKEGKPAFDIFQATAEVLSEKVDTVRDGGTNSFVELGGDSVRAAMLSFEAENAGVDLPVQSILGTASLADLHDQVSTDSESSTVNTTADVEAPPFSLLGRGCDKITKEATELLDDDTTEILDILPCTSQQGRLFLGSVREPGAYISQWRFALPQEVDVQRLRTALAYVYRHVQLLRTRIFQASDGRCYQMVLDDGLIWHDTEHDCKTDLEVDNGSALARFGVTSTAEGSYVFVLTAHHALYDRWSFDLIVSDICHAYNEQSAPADRPPFSRYLDCGDQAEAEEHYRKYLSESPSVHFPTLPSPTYRSNASSFYTSSYELPSTYNGSMAALVTTAWSLVVSAYSDSHDATFGFTTWGRDTSVKGVLEMAAPTFNTVPIRVELNSDDSLNTVLKQVEEQLVQLTKVQRFGTDDISKINEQCRSVCQFQNVLVVQPKPRSNHDQSRVLKYESCERILPRQAHPLVLEATVTDGGFDFAWSYDPNIISEEACSLMRQHLSNALNSLLRDPERKIIDFSMAGQQDFHKIATWNSGVEDWTPSTLDAFVTSGADEHPERLALTSRQESLTYMQLNARASRLAGHLSASCQLQPGESVALILERSTFTIVSMIAVLMLGAIYVPLDHKNPASRIRQIVEESQSKVVICTNDTNDKARELNCRVLNLDHEMDHIQSQDSEVSSSKAQPDHTAYVIYTSGSTGTPKGVVVRHSAMSASVRALAKRWELNHDSRVCHASSIAFDASVLEIYCTLSAGGTICVASEHDKLEASDFLKDFDVTFAAMTPSESIALDPESLPALETLVLWAEPLPVSEMKRWASAKHLIQGYGPTECCGVCVTASMSANMHPQMLGHAVGGTTWIVSPRNPSVLAPIGTVGELVISGKTLAEGYHGQPETTQSVFKERLEWMDNFQERLHGRAYLTGDLVQYSMDGDIKFIRRKAGGYVKIAGNRIDLGEITYHLSSQGLLPYLSVVLTQAFGDQDTSLVACFAVDEGDVDDCELLQLTDKTRSRCQEARKALMSCVPAYMIPTVFVPFSNLPRTTGGKIDQNSVKSLLEELDPEEALKQYTVRENIQQQNSNLNDSKLTEEGRLMRNMWCQVVDIEEAQIGDNSHFFACGGNSAMAFRLVAAARTQGYTLRVADVYKHPCLNDMSTYLQSSEVQPGHELSRFSLLPAKGRDGIKQNVAQLLGVSVDDIEDAYPCSAYQRWMVENSDRLTGAYIRHHLFELDSSVSMDRVREVCHGLAEQNPTLRTRVTKVKGEMFQAVIRSPGKCETFRGSPHEYVRDHDDDFGSDKSLSRFAISEDQDRRWLVWSIHHSRYDGYSIGLLFSRLASILSRQQDSETTNTKYETQTGDMFPKIIRYLSSVNNETARSFWSTYLSKFEATSNDVVSKGYNNLTDTQSRREVDLSLRRGQFSPGAVLRTAFAMTLSSHTNTQDIVFGTTVPGRDLPIDGIEQITGQTMIRLPIRILLNGDQKMRSLLQKVEDDFITAISHQTLQFDQIQDLNDSCERACNYDVHFIVQNDEDSTGEADRILEQNGWKQVETHTSMPYPYPLFVECTPRKDTVLVEVKYSSRNFDPEFVEGLITDFVEVAQRLDTREDTRTVEDVRAARG